MPKLTCSQVELALNQAKESFPHAACWECECFLGYVARLRVDSGGECKELFAPYQVSRSNIHSCLGCGPCPPGALFAEYTRGDPKVTLLQL
jgi:hypothetical protein